MIKRFRFIRSFLFALRVLFIYLLVFTLKRVVPDSWYRKVLHLVNRFVARRIKLYILRLRGIFIKLGQFLGVMGNLFWPDISKELQSLQDRVPPVDYESIRQRFINDFNKPPEELFRSFEKNPLASASLGQVHLAVTHDGRKVAVKTLYLGIKELVKKDLKSIRAILSLIHLIFPTFDFKLVHKEFSDMIQAEIDYHQERKNLEEIKANFKDEQEFFFPEVLGEYSSATVLTTEYVEGIKIDHVQEMKQKGIDTKHVAQLLIKAYCKMFFLDQKFHSDPHPGNLFVMNDSSLRIAFIDFGSVEVFTERFRRNIPKLIKSIINMKISNTVDTLEDMGFMTRFADREQIELLLAYRYDKLRNLKISDYRKLNINDFNDFDALKKLNLKLSEVIRSFQVPRNYIYFARTVSLLTGLAAQLDPKVNIFQIAWPYLEEFVIGKDKTITDFLKGDLRDLLSDMISLPEQSIKALETVNQGKLKVQIKDLNKNTKILYILGHQIIYTLLLITSAVFSLVLFINQIDSYKYFIYLAGLFCVILIISIFRHRKLKNY